jgi:hypothetical protein
VKHIAVSNIGLWPGLVQHVGVDLGCVFLCWFLVRVRLFLEHCSFRHDGEPVHGQINNWLHRSDIMAYPWGPLWCYIVLANVENVGVLALNVVMYQHMGRTLYKPVSQCDDTPYAWLVVTDLSQWEGSQVQHVGHAWKVLTDSIASGSSSSSAAAAPPAGAFSPCSMLLTGAWMSLMAGAAYEGFMAIGVATLIVLADDHDIPLPANRSLFNVLKAILSHYLTGWTEADIISLIEKRLTGTSDGDPIFDVLNSAEVYDAFGEEEIKILNSWKKDQTTKSMQQSTLQKDVSDRCESIAKDFLAKKLGKKPVDPKLRGLVSLGTRLYPHVVEANQLSEHDALNFLPPDSKVYKSNQDNRWKLSWCGYKITRCWTLHGELGAFAQCAAYLWSSYHKFGGQPCPFDWINASES